MINPEYQQSFVTYTPTAFMGLLLVIGSIAILQNPVSNLHYSPAELEAITA